MKTRQLVITRIIKNAAFAKTIHGNEENIFVPFHTRGVIGETSGGNPKLLKSRNTPKYFLKKGDKIVSIIVDGNENCRKAGIWIPLSVWTVWKGEDSDKKVSTPSFLEQIDLPFLDKIKDRNTLIRVRPPSGHGQIYYGPLDMFNSKAHVLSRANNLENVFEAFVGNKWVKIWPPLVTKKPKPLQQKVFGRNRKKVRL
jgi:hypothetical protein